MISLKNTLSAIGSSISSITSSISSITSSLGNVPHRTLLFSGYKNTTINLTDSPYNYDEVHIEYRESASTSGTGVRMMVCPMGSYYSDSKVYLLGYGWNSTTAMWQSIAIYHFTTTQLVLDAFTRTNDGYQGSNQSYITKVYGIKYGGGYCIVSRLLKALGGRDD